MFSKDQSRNKAMFIYKSIQREILASDQFFNRACTVVVTYIRKLGIDRDTTI